MELSGASFETTAPARPCFAPDSKVCALFNTGPMLPLAALIFAETSSLMNLLVAECFASIPYAAFFTLFASSNADSALVFESRNESSFCNAEESSRNVNETLSSSASRKFFVGKLSYAEDEIDYPVRHAQLQHADLPLVPVGPVTVRFLVVVSLHNVYLIEIARSVNLFSGERGEPLSLPLPRVERSS